MWFLGEKGREGGREGAVEGSSDSPTGETERKLEPAPGPPNNFPASPQQPNLPAFVLSPLATNAPSTSPFPHLSRLHLSDFTLLRWGRAMLPVVAALLPPPRAEAHRSCALRHAFTGVGAARTGRGSRLQGGWGEVRGVRPGTARTGRSRLGGLARRPQAVSGPGPAPRPRASSTRRRPGL